MWEKPSPKKRDKKGRVDGWSNQDSPIRTYTQNIQKRIREGREAEEAPPLKEECQHVKAAPMKKLVQECKIVFLPLGRTTGKGTLLKMCGGPETCSSIPVLMLKDVC